MATSSPPCFTFARSSRRKSIARPLPVTHRLVTTTPGFHASFAMAELARANGIHVVLSSVMPVSNYGRDRDGNTLDVRLKRPPEKILALNVWIKKYAEENGHVYLDYFSAMVDEHGLLKKGLSEDGLHPNSAGYAVMAPLAEQAIQATLAGKASK